MVLQNPLRRKTSTATLTKRESRANSLHNDAQRLAEMGYTQELSRGFSVLSILGTAFSLTNSWFGLSAAMATGINSGGPVLLVYGIIIVTIASTGVGVSLSELPKSNHSRFQSFLDAHNEACP
jgi:choline transport protein